MVVWLIGLSNAGKTTVGRRLVERWRTVDPATVLVDGDAVRSLFAEGGAALGHGIDDRRVANRRTIAVCEWLDAQGINAVACQVTFFPEHRAAHHERVRAVTEVHLDVDLDVARARDRRGIYDSAVDVAGVDLPFYPPPPPALVLDAAHADPDELASKVLGHLGVPA